MRIPARADAARASSRVSSNARTRGARAYSMYRMSEYIYIYTCIGSVVYNRWCARIVGQRRTRGCPNARVDAHGDARARVRFFFFYFYPRSPRRCGSSRATTPTPSRAGGDARQSSTGDDDDDRRGCLARARRRRRRRRRAVVTSGEPWRATVEAGATVEVGAARARAREDEDEDEDGR